MLPTRMTVNMLLEPVREKSTCTYVIITVHVGSVHLPEYFVTSKTPTMSVSEFHYCRDVRYLGHFYLSSIVT